MATRKSQAKEVAVEDKLKTLYQLQVVASEIDKLHALRGELPLEVKDMEDEIEGLETRANNYAAEIEDLNAKIADKRIEMQNAEQKIARLSEHQDAITNSRDYDNNQKEIEYQQLEIQLCEKRIKEYTAAVQTRQEELEKTQEAIDGREGDLDQKKSELDTIIAENKEREDALRDDAKIIEIKIDDHLLTAFKRIRKNARNGLAVVTVERDACGGCFNRIPAQRQIDIRQRKKIIVCEYCGRILVDADLPTEVKIRKK